MKILSRDAFIKLDSSKKEFIKIDGDTGVYVQTMSTKSRAEIELLVAGKEQYKERFKKLRELIAVYSVVDEEGNYLFTEDDIDMLSDKSCKILDQIYVVAQRLSFPDVKELEALAKN